MSEQKLRSARKFYMAHLGLWSDPYLSEALPFLLG